MRQLDFWPLPVKLLPAPANWYSGGPVIGEWVYDDKRRGYWGHPQLPTGFYDKGGTIVYWGDWDDQKKQAGLAGRVWMRGSRLMLAHKYNHSTVRESEVGLARAVLRRYIRRRIKDKTLILIPRRLVENDLETPTLEYWDEAPKWDNPIETAFKNLLLRCHEKYDGHNKTWEARNCGCNLPDLIWDLIEEFFPEFYKEADHWDNPWDLPNVFINGQVYRIRTFHRPATSRLQALCALHEKLVLTE